MLARNVVIGVVTSTVVFLLLFTLLDRAGAPDYWVLVGAILGGLLTARAVDRVLRGPRRR